MRTAKVLAAFAVLLMVTSSMFVAVSQESDGAYTELKIVDSYYVETDGNYSVVVKLNRDIMGTESMSGGVINDGITLCFVSSIPSTTTKEVKFALSNVTEPSDIDGAYVYILNGTLGKTEAKVNCLVTADLNGGTAPKDVEDRGWTLSGNNYVRSFAFGTEWSAVQDNFGTPTFGEHKFSGWSQIGKVQSSATMAALWDAESYKITVVQTTGGTVKTDVTSAIEDARVNLSYTVAEGYEFKKWDVYSDQGQITVLKDSKGYYFLMPAADVTVKAEFGEAKDLVIVTAPVASEGYAVDSPGTKSIPKGSDYTFTVTVSKGYKLDGAELSVSAEGSYVSITATKVPYAPNQYTVTIVNITSDVSKIVVNNIVPKTTVVTLDYLGKVVTATFNRDMPDGGAVPVKEKSIFMGYFDDEGVKYYNSDMTSARKWDKVSATATLYASWAPAPLENRALSYDGNDATIFVEEEFPTKYYAEGAAFTVLSGDDTTKIAKTGYKFAGWTDGVKIYQPGTTYVMGSSDVALKAVWEVVTPTPEKVRGDVTVRVYDKTEGDVYKAQVFIDGVLKGTTDEAGGIVIKNVTFEPHSLVVKVFKEGEEVAIVTKAISPSETETTFYVETNVASNVKSSVEVTEGSDLKVIGGNLDSIAQKYDKDIDLVIDNSNVTMDKKQDELREMYAVMYEETGATSTQFFDAKLYKDKKEFKDNDNIVEIILEFDTSHKINFTVSHYHNGQAVILTQIGPNDTPAQDTYYIKDGWIHIFTIEFSSFGLGYVDVLAGHDIVTFHDGDKFNQIQVEHGYKIGTSISELPTPSKEGYRFNGWVDENGKRITLDTVVSEKMDVYAKWSENPSNDNSMIYIIIGIVAALLVIAIAVIYYFTRIY